MRHKTFEGHRRFGAGSCPDSSDSCEEIQEINRKLLEGEEISEFDVAKAMEHTRTCDRCGKAFLDLAARVKDEVGSKQGADSKHDGQP